MKYKIALLTVSVLALGACAEMYAPPHLNTARMQVREETVTEQVPVSAVTEDYLAGLSSSYQSNGRGPVMLTVTYDPESRSNTAMKASDEASRIARSLRKNGVGHVQTSVLPVREQGGESLAMINFTSYQAAAPDGCGTMPGYAALNVDHDPSYKTGCTVETLLAKQISDPSDLLGEAQPTPTTDGRRASNIIESYRFGAPNEPLKGEMASE